MKKKSILLLMGAAFALLTLNSCRTRSGAHGRNANLTTKTLLTAYESYDVELADTPIEYVIDVTTEAGAAKLRGLSLKQAEELVLREAIIKNKCASIHQPQFTNVMKGKRVLRIRVYGFPAKYKNQQ